LKLKADEVLAKDKVKPSNTSLMWSSKYVMSVRRWRLTLSIIHAIDLRSLFLALHRVEEFGIDRPIPKPFYKRNEILQITGWSRATLWRKCDEIGLPARKKAFTLPELEKLVQWNND